jgi:hypothetical protein
VFDVSRSFNDFANAYHALKLETSMSFRGTENDVEDTAKALRIFKRAALYARALTEIERRQRMRRAAAEMFLAAASAAASCLNHDGHRRGPPTSTVRYVSIFLENSLEILHLKGVAFSLALHTI